jgi:hypothetical protein
MVALDIRASCILLIRAHSLVCQVTRHERSIARARISNTGKCQRCRRTGHRHLHLHRR